MAYDKAVDSTQLDAGLTEIANAIRTKGGTEAQLTFPGGFASAIQAIPTGRDGVDIVITSTITNAIEFSNALANSGAPAQYFFAIKTYQNGTPASNQAICGAAINATRIGIRYRNGEYAGMGGWSPQYDLVATIGDIYTIWEVDI